MVQRHCLDVWHTAAIQETHLSPSSLKLSMPSGCLLSARVFFLISLPVRRLPLLDSAWNRTHTVHSHPLYLHRYINTLTITSTAVWPWPGSLRNWLPCRRALSFSWRHHQPSSWLPLPLFCDVPPVRWRRQEHHIYMLKLISAHLLGRFDTMLSIFVYMLYIKSGVTQFEKIEKQLYYSITSYNLGNNCNMQLYYWDTTYSLGKYMTGEWDQVILLFTFCVSRSVCVTAILFCLSFSFSALTLWISARSDRRRSWWKAKQASHDANLKAKHHLDKKTFTLPVYFRTHSKTKAKERFIVQQQVHTSASVAFKSSTK